MKTLAELDPAAPDYEEGVREVALQYVRDDYRCSSPLLIGAIDWLARTTPKRWRKLIDYRDAIFDAITFLLWISTKFEEYCSDVAEARDYYPFTHPLFRFRFIVNPRFRQVRRFWRWWRIEYRNGPPDPTFIPPEADAEEIYRIISDMLEDRIVYNKQHRIDELPWLRKAIERYGDRRVKEAATPLPSKNGS
jgi:hypothetical protein